MSEIDAREYPDAKPLGPGVKEMATARIKVIVADSDAFHIAGRIRTAFVVGSRARPIDVIYSPDASCTEYVLPAWAGTAVLGVSGRDLSDEVNDIDDLPSTPFLSAIGQGMPHALEIARRSYKDWQVGAGKADARIAEAVWQRLHSDPSGPLHVIAQSLGISDRRMRAAMRQETGLRAGQWRKLLRLERATVALTQTGQSLAAVAAAAGYADQSHMTRDYAALAGTTPLALRKAALAR